MAMHKYTITSVTRSCQIQPLIRLRLDAAALFTYLLCSVAEEYTLREFRPIAFADTEVF